jgi:hypothetical protein
MIEKSLGDPIVAAKRYNGCSGCRADRSPCNNQGIFGVGGQFNYAEKFAKSVNTFLVMFPDAAGVHPGSRLALTFFLLGAVGYWYLDKKYKTTDALVGKLAEAI